MTIYPAAVQITFIHPAVLLYMSMSCRRGSRVTRAFYDVEKPFLFSDFAAFVSEGSDKQPGK